MLDNLCQEAPVSSRPKVTTVLDFEKVALHNIIAGSNLWQLLPLPKPGFKVVTVETLRNLIKGGLPLCGVPVRGMSGRVQSKLLGLDNMRIVIASDEAPSGCGSLREDSCSGQVSMGDNNLCSIKEGSCIRFGFDSIPVIPARAIRSSSARISSRRLSLSALKSSGSEQRLQVQVNMNLVRRACCRVRRFFKIPSVSFDALIVVLLCVVVTGMIDTGCLKENATSKVHGQTIGSDNSKVWRGIVVTRIDVAHRQEGFSLIRRKAINLSADGG
ncbi:hypothetical protein HG531_012285 [Fusarium graminearum]|nr:hypothetical protein HG531_012285 [Fusarium graminearum]